MARSPSSKQWLKEHFDDAYVKRSQEELAHIDVLDVTIRDQLLAELGNMLTRGSNADPRTIKQLSDFALGKKPEDEGDG